MEHPFKTGLPSAVRFIDRGSDQLMICVQGWGFSGDMFVNLFTEQNLLIFPTMLSGNETSLLLTVLTEILGSHQTQITISKVFIIAWSLGCHLLLDTLALIEEDSQHSILHQISGLLLIAYLPRYQDSNIDDLHSGIINNMERTLKEFYMKCFYRDKTAYRRFRSEIQNRLLGMADRDQLLQGLDYLRTRSDRSLKRLLRLDEDRHNYSKESINCPVHTNRILPIFCDKDIVVPIKELEVQSVIRLFNLSDVHCQIINAPHFPFFSYEFHRIFDTFQG